MEKIFTGTLDNGLRIIHVAHHSNVTYAGFAIDVGSRDELDDEHGLAHFCEHIIFKGTKKRKAWHVLNRMDSVGGDLNAYTNKEETVVYSAFTREHLSRAIELITDIVFSSTFPQHEIDKEVEVIADEIESYNDSPAELIFDEFENLIFKNHPLGHDILGKADKVRTYTTEDALRFTGKHYTPSNMICFVYGDYENSYVMKTLNRICGGIRKTSLEFDVQNCTHGSVSTGDKWRLLPTDYEPQTKIVNKSTHQAHVMIGTRAYAADDKRRTALYFLNNLLGGPGMNSLLNIALREHCGLVYTVESSLTNYTDTGTFAVYFGCNAKDVDKCLGIIHKECKKLRDSVLTRRKFDRAMKQMRGQIIVACDNAENYALDVAKAYLHYNRFEGIDDTVSQLENLSLDFIVETANDILDEKNMSTLIYM